MLIPLLNLDPTLYGWQKDETSKPLIPVTTPAGTKPAALEIGELIQCGCVSGEPCKTGRCGCSAAQLSCTVFCACGSNGQCCNKWTKKDVVDDDESDVEEGPCYENDN